MISRKLLAASLNFPDLMSVWAALISRDPADGRDPAVFICDDGCDDCGSEAGAVVWLIAVPISNATISDSRNAVTPQERMQTDYMHSSGMIWLVIRVPV